jgi:hypothetical protein
LVDTDDERTLRQVFERTNTAGKRLRAAEIFQALHVGLSGEQPSTISDFVEEIAELGYGWLDEDTVRHAALAIAGQDPLRRTPAADRFPGAREGLVAAAIAPIKRALSFLAEDAEIPSVEVLPYTLPVSVLAALFARFPHVHERNRLLLVRWLWRGILSGNLAGSPVGKARAAYRTVQAGANESQTVQTLLSQVPKVRSQVPSFADRFKLSSAATRVLLSCSWSLEPVNLSAFLDRDERIAVRPGDLLGSTPGGPGSVRDALRDLPALGGLVMAGARLLTPLPSGDVFSHLRSVVEKAPELLASHGFDQTAVTLLRAGASAEEVCGARVAHLDDVLRRFTERLARWEEDDRPPLAPLLDEGAAYPWLDELL